MKGNQNMFAGVVVALLAVVAYGVYWTEAGRTRPTVPVAAESDDAAPALNESSLITAQRLVRLPTTAEELVFAQEVLRLADKDMDLAFADAVRQAAAHPAPMTKEAKEVEERLQRAERELLADS